MPIEDVVVPERRTRPIEPDVYRSLSSSAVAYELMCDGTISLVRSKSAPFGIQAFNRVGQALLEDGRQLIVAEKVASSLTGLLRWSLPSDIREAAVPSPAGAGSPVLMTFAGQFLRHTGDYLGAGRVKEYRERVERSPFPRGRVDVPETVRSYSRGRRGVLGFRRAHLTSDVPVNRLIALGLLAVETYASANPAATHARDLSRGLAPIFEDADCYSLMQSDHDAKSAAFEDALSDERVAGSLRSALAFARALVLHLGAWPREYTAALPSAYFINLESLFEDAVRQILTDALQPHLQVAKGDALYRPLFPERPDHYVADPDAVISLGNVPLLVVDCKYKDIEHQRGRPLPLHADVYELHTHCAALGSRKGLLVYPGEAYAYGVLGRTPSGIEISYAVVPIADLRRGLLVTLGHVGLPAATEEGNGGSGDAGTA